MAISSEKAQELCSKTEWETIVNSFPPRLSELTPAVLKKQANRVRRFLDKERTEPAAEGRVPMFEEALQRLEEARSQEAGENEKLAARREKEKAAKERKKSVTELRSDVRTKLKEKAEKEKAEKEGDAKEPKAKQGGGKGVRGHLQAAASGNQKKGTRKV